MGQQLGAAVAMLAVTSRGRRKVVESVLRYDRSPGYRQVRAALFKFMNGHNFKPEYADQEDTKQKLRRR